MHQTLTFIYESVRFTLRLSGNRSAALNCVCEVVLLFLLGHAVRCWMLRLGSDIDVDSELACNRRPKQPHAIACSPRITAGRAAMRVTHASTAG